MTMLVRRNMNYRVAFKMLLNSVSAKSGQVRFKRINDTLGHQKGDETLSKFAIILEKSKRDLDICARYGGEEFMLVLPHTELHEANIIAERLRIIVENSFKDDIGLTTSYTGPDFNRARN